MCVVWKYLQYSKGSNLVGVRHIHPEEVQAKLGWTDLPQSNYFRDVFDYSLTPWGMRA